MYNIRELYIAYQYSGHLQYITCRIFPLELLEMFKVWYTKRERKLNRHTCTYIYYIVCSADSSHVQQQLPKTK